MKRITFIRAVQTQFGGAENFLTRLCNELKKQGVSFDELHSHLPKWIPSWVRAWIFNYRVRFQKGKKFYFALDRIDSADIYRAGDGVHKAFIETRHKSRNPLHWTYCALEKRCFRNAKRIIANSQLVKQDLINFYDVDEKKIRIIYNGINIQCLDRNQAKEAIQSEFPQATNKPIIMMAGTGFERKGVIAFLTELKKLKSDFHAFIVGKDKNQFKYEMLAAEMGLKDQVTFTGMRSDIDQFYQAAEIYLFIPKYEPFGNVVLEALSFGTPAFAGPNCGAADLLPNEWKLDEQTPSKIDALLSNQEKWQSASNQALEIARAHPIEKTTEETLAVIKEVMNEH